MRQRTAPERSDHSGPPLAASTARSAETRVIADAPRVLWTKENCYTSSTFAVDIMNGSSRLESIARRCAVDLAPLHNVSSENSIRLTNALGVSRREPAWACSGASGVCAGKRMTMAN